MLRPLPFAVTRGRFGSLTLIGLFALVPISIADKTPETHDPRMRRIVAEFESTASAAPRRFRADLAIALDKCGTNRDLEAFFHTLVNKATEAERKLSSALQAADRGLRERARSVKGADAVLGAAGDLTRSVARLEMASLRVSTEMSESLSLLKGGRFGGEPFLTTLQLRLVSIVYRTPVGFGAILTVYVVGSPTAFVHVDGFAPAESSVTIAFTCGGVSQTLQEVANDEGRWGASTNVALSGSKTCTVTATAGTGISAGSITTEIHFP